MNILIACDSFKDALDAPTVCRAIERGLTLANPQIVTQIFPLSDGGEGMSDILNYHLGLKTIEITVNNPLFRKIKARYSITEDASTAFIEMAEAAGLQLLIHQERNPLKTTTFGVGEMIQDALTKGAKRIILGIGGSATNDGGMGMAAALGWQFLDKNGKKLAAIGENLIKIEKIVPPLQWDTFAPEGKSKGIMVEVMSDVKNPLFGKTGSSHMYARQKGANDTDIETLEKGIIKLWKVSNASKSVAETAGAGAAGGLGFGTLIFLNAIIQSGIDIMMDLTEFDKQVAWADVIVTGEGRLDNQTAHGKLIAGIISRAQGKPVVALCGALEMTPQYVRELGLKAAFSIAQKPCSLPEALTMTAENLEKTAFNVGQLLC